jgi:two-component system OmpR family sensor kinase
MIFKSIKWRLQLWYGVSLLIVLVGFGLTAYQLERSSTLRKIDEELQRRADVLLPVLRRPPPQEGQFPPPRGDRPREEGPPERRFETRPRELRIPAQVESLFEAENTNGFYYLIIWRDGREIARSANAPGDDRQVVLGGNFGYRNVAPQVVVSQDREVAPAAPSPTGLNERFHLDRFAQKVSPTMRGTFRETQVVTLPGERIVVGRNIAPELKEFRLMGLRLVVVGGVILVLGVAIGWWLASRALRPIAAISCTAEEIAGGDLSKRINSSETESELGQLAGVLNSTFARLDATFAQQKQFTSDAAHELRTPVAVILTQTQSTLTKERSPAEYRETLEACQRAAQRMRRLIESLLELARFDAGQEGMKRTRFDLANPTRDCIEMLLPLADERKIRIQAQLVPAACHGDPERITQVVVNLLTNAVNHNKAGGEIQIVTRAENGSAVLIISDNGPGISAEHLPHIFDRFYCVDAARNSSQGRSGLGLAISKAIVEAHGGMIEVSSKVGAGTVFTVRLPVM